MKQLLCALLLLPSCKILEDAVRHGPPPPEACYPGHNFGRFTSYPVNFTGRTPAGVEVDDPEGELDRSKVDAVFLSVARCMEQFAAVPLTAEELQANECAGPFETEIRPCISVKVPSWAVSPCSGEQLFSCNVGPQRCREKGQEPSATCPCGCRGIIQDNTILVTPNLKLLPAQLVTMMTGCLSPWSGRLEQCSDPGRHVVTP